MIVLPSQPYVKGKTVAVLLCPGLLEQMLKVLGAPERNVGSLHRNTEYLRWHIGYQPGDLVDRLRSDAAWRPDGICEEAWGDYVSDFIIPALEDAEAVSSWQQLLRKHSVQSVGVLLHAVVHASQHERLEDAREVFLGFRPKCTPLEHWEGLWRGMSPVMLASIRRNCGWMWHLFGARRLEDAAIWPVFHHLSMVHARFAATGSCGSAGTPARGDLERFWGNGCRPVWNGAALEAVVLRLPVLSVMPGAVARGGDAPAGQPGGNWSIPACLLAGSDRQAAAVEQPRNQDLWFTDFLLTPSRASFMVEAFAAAAGQGKGGVLAASSRGSGKARCMQALALMMTVGAGGDAFILSCEILRAVRSGARGWLGKLLHGFLSLCCGGALTHEGLRALLSKVSEHDSGVQHLQQLTDLVNGLCGSVRGGASATPRILLVEDGNFVHAELLKCSPASRAAWDTLLRRLLSLKRLPHTVLFYSDDLRARKPAEGRRGTMTACDAVVGGACPAHELGITTPALAMKVLSGSLIHHHDAGSGCATGSGSAGAQEDESLHDFPQPLKELRLQMRDSDPTHREVTNLVCHVGCDLGVIFALTRTLSSPDYAHQGLVDSFTTALGSVGQEQCRWLREHLRQMVGDTKEAPAHHCLGLLGSCIAAPASGKGAAKYMGGKAKSFLIRSSFSQLVVQHAVQVLTVEAVNEEGVDSFDKVLSGKLGSHKAMIDGKVFERAEAVLLDMGLAGGGVAMHPSDQEQHLPKLLTDSRPSVAWRAAFEAGQLPPICRNAAVGNCISLADVAAIHQLGIGEHHTIHTSHVFPGIDHVTVGLKELGTATVVTVTFQESTMSPFHVHAKKKAIQAILSKWRADGNEFQVPRGVARELTWLTAVPRWMVHDVADGKQPRVKIVRKRDIVQDASVMGLLSAILQGIGIPILAEGEMRWEGAGSTRKQVLKLHKAAASPSQLKLIDERVKRALACYPRGEEGDPVPQNVITRLEPGQVHLRFNYRTFTEEGPSQQLDSNVHVDIPGVEVTSGRSCYHGWRSHAAPSEATASNAGEAAQ